MARVHDPTEMEDEAAAIKPSAPETPPTSVESTAIDWDTDSVTASRQSRSQSLTDPRMMRPTTLDPAASTTSSSSSVEGDAGRSVTFLVVDTACDEELVTQRQMRRTKSAEFHCTSLSLLQQELGYPRPFKSLPVSGESVATPSSHSRSRRGSRRSRHSASVSDKDESRYGRPAAASDAATVLTSENEDDEEEENFLDHRLASVTGYARDTDGVVYYEIVVESTAHGPLSAYKVRRRYSEFRDLHRALAKVMSTRKPKHSSSSSSRRSLHHDSRLSLGALDTDTESSYSPRAISRSLHDESSTGLGGFSVCALPPLPDSGGLWSYLQGESPRFLENRARAFHAIITAAQQHPQARASRLLNKFLGPPPDSFANSNYVSLNRFAAPTLRFAIEIQERKEMAKTISLKRRQLDKHHASSTKPPSIAE